MTPEWPPYVEGASERTPDGYYPGGSTLPPARDTPQSPASRKINTIHLILDSYDGEEALKRIREVLYG